MKFAFLVGALWLATLSGCGTVGPPIPPEDIGVAAKLEKEKARAKLQPPPPEKDKDEDRPEDEEQQLSLPR
jgi:hypothetical protein